MDPTTVDRLSRLLASTPSRRSALAGLGGALVARLTGQARQPTAAAAAAPCATGKKRCKGRCIPQRQCCTSGECRTDVPGTICRRGRCVCRPGTKRCQDRCLAKTACCGRCRGGKVCDRGRCAPPRCGTGGPCRVFVSSATFTGDLRENGRGSGIAGADAKCQRLANASSRTQGGTYQAWVSGVSPATSPSQRFTKLARTGPYVLTDDAGTMIASTWADLTDGALLAPIDRSESGLRILPSVPFIPVWTRTRFDGTPSNNGGGDCDEWTDASLIADIGSLEFADQGWTEAGTSACLDPAGRLYCFEQG